MMADDHIITPGQSGVVQVPLMPMPRTIFENANRILELLKAFEQNEFPEDNSAARAGIPNQPGLTSLTGPKELELTARLSEYVLRDTPVRMAANLQTNSFKIFGRGGTLTHEHIVAANRKLKEIEEGLASPLRTQLMAVHPDLIGSLGAVDSFEELLQYPGAPIASATVPVNQPAEMIALANNIARYRGAVVTFTGRGKSQASAQESASLQSMQEQLNREMQEALSGIMVPQVAIVGMQPDGNMSVFTMLHAGDEAVLPMATGAPNFTRGAIPVMGTFDDITVTPGASAPNLPQVPPTRSKKKSNIEQGEADKQAAAANIENQARQIKDATALKALKTAKTPKPYALTGLENGLKYLEYSSPIVHRDNTVILADTVRALATALDVRSDEMLELGGAAQSEIAHVTMQRQLTEMLLAKKTLRRAANAIHAPLAFGEQTAKDETKLAATIEANTVYLKTHPEAQQFLLRHAQSNPGLILLLQASLLSGLMQPKEDNMALNESVAYLAALKKESPNMDDHKGEFSTLFVAPQLEELLYTHCRAENAARFKKPEGATLAESIQPKQRGTEGNPHTQFTR